MSKLIKNRDGNFTHIKNDIFDSGLSAKAIGLFCYLCHLPDDWHFYVEEIATHFKDGKDAIQSGLKELQQAGFLTRIQSKDDSTGKFKRFDWELNEAPNINNSPQPDFPAPDNPAPGKPAPDNPPLQNTKSTKYEDNKISSSSGDDFVDSKPSSLKSFDAYQQLWGFPNAIVREDIQSWINDTSDELVSYAIEIAARNNVSSRGANKYLEAILTAWKNADVTTVEQAKKQNEEHNNRIDREFKSHKSYNKPIKRESIPDDWGKHEQQTPVDAKKKAELEERIKKLREKGNKK